MALVAVLSACFLLCACTSAARGERPAAANPPRVGTVLDGPVPRRVLDLPLVDHRGRRLTIGSLKGRVVVVSDVATLCQETCAVGTAGLVQAARAIDGAGLGDRVELLSITIDPSRDDVAHLAAYRRQFAPPGSSLGSPLGNWETATGSATDIGYLWDTLGVWRRRVHLSAPYPRDWLTGRPLTSDIQHTDDLVFIDAHQRFRFLIDGPGSVRSRGLVPSRIYTFMDTAGRQIVRRPTAGSWSAAEVEQVVRWLVGEGGASP